jgi:hypothetical protein
VAGARQNNKKKAKLDFVEEDEDAVAMEIDVKDGKSEVEARVARAARVAARLALFGMRCVHFLRTMRAQCALFPISCGKWHSFALHFGNENIEYF